MYFFDIEEKVSTNIKLFSRRWRVAYGNMNKCKRIAFGNLYKDLYALVLFLLLLSIIVLLLSNSFYLSFFFFNTFSAISNLNNYHHHQTLDLNFFLFLDRLYHYLSPVV